MAPPARRISILGSPVRQQATATVAFEPLIRSGEGGSVRQGIDRSIRATRTE
jgi:hypothetical protein